MARIKSDPNRFIRLYEAHEWTPAYVVRAVIVKKLGEIYTSDSPFKDFIPQPLRDKPPIVLAGSSVQLERFPGIYVSIQNYSERQFLGPDYRIGNALFDSVDSILIADVVATIVILAESLDQRDMLLSTTKLAFMTYFVGYYEVEASGAIYVIGFDRLDTTTTFGVDETIGNYPIYYATFNVNTIISSGVRTHGYDVLYKANISAQ